MLEKDLLNKAENIAGLTIQEVAAMLNQQLPPNLNTNKGWVGILIEKYLGATAKSQALQDFPTLGIELKTIPISQQGKPLETTFICLAPLTQNIGITWETSHVRHKLSKILWIPIEGERTIPLAERRIGSPILWQPNNVQEQALKYDWEELMEFIVLGKVQQITARIGQVLQLRPKASNNKEKTIAIGIDGEKILTNPLGFYLRKEFTQQIISNFLS